MTIAAIILAGGQGRRMGYVNKANLILGDQRFIDRQLQVASGWTDERIVVVSSDERAVELKLPEDVRVVMDKYAGEGPLAGLHAGIEAMTSPFAWVIGCDMPFIDAKAADKLLTSLLGGDFQAAVPIIEERPQPLHAVYRKEIGDIAGRLLVSGNRRLLSLLDEIKWINVYENEFEASGITARFANDVDTPEQYERLNHEKEQ
ncbi:molybdenum cofactor guanylyltransferase [Cohnella yongneupensis]|uniref:Probable molybdenum cofactor guanylyltransferase n=1 Tax=Cohnella yongneupensis TaxID=425006 RepID=A0ABW0R3S3_9BACL